MKKTFVMIIAILAFFSLISCQRDMAGTTDTATTAVETALADTYDKITTYDDILEMYKNIVSTYPTFSEEQFDGGMYDDMYNFSNGNYYEIFKAVFLSGYEKRQSTYYYWTDYIEGGNYIYGYAQKDINGDSVEELILLTDSFEIIAIFTMKDENVVLLDSYSSNQHTFIDSEGLIHVKTELGGATGRDAEYALYKINNSMLDCIFKIGSSINFSLKPTDCYKIENGQKISISNDKYDTLYSQYESKLDSYNGVGEITKTFANLEFSPIFKNNTHVISFKNKLHTGNPINQSGIIVTAVAGDRITFDMDYHKSDEINHTTIYNTVISATATLEDGKYTFSNGQVSGYVEFGFKKIWVTITESTEPYIDCRSFLYQYYED